MASLALNRIKQVSKDGGAWGLMRTEGETVTGAMRAETVELGPFMESKNHTTVQPSLQLWREMRWRQRDGHPNSVSSWDQAQGRSAAAQPVEGPGQGFHWRELKRTMQQAQLSERLRQLEGYILNTSYVGLGLWLGYSNHLTCVRSWVPTPWMMTTMMRMLKIQN